MHLSTTSLFSLLIPVTFYSPISLAQPEPLETVVVTASGYEQTINQAASSISVLQREELEKIVFKDLTDALRKIPGVAVTGGGSRRDMSIRGLPAEYTVILIDGRKRSGRETQPGSSGGFEQDWLPPAEAIERIEVVRGPMSTLYGSDAMGGVINIVTRKDYGGWRANLRTEALLQENSDSGNHYQGQLRFSGPLIKDRLSVNLSALVQQRDEDSILRGYAEKSLDNLHAALNYQATDSDEYRVELSRQTQTRISTAGLSLPLNANSNQTDNQRSAASLAHEGRYQSFGGNSFIQYDETQNEGREITLKNTSANTQWYADLGRHAITFGSNFDEQKLQDQSTNLNREVDRIRNRQWSLFAEHDWQIHPAVGLTGGLRLDNNQQFDTHFSPRLYVVWQTSPNWTIKTGAASGYRAPDLRQVAPDWIQQSRGGNIFGNPDLQPETTLSTELAFLYNNGDAQFTLTLFQNDFTDKIALQVCPATVCGAEDNPRYNVNIDDAVTQGSETSFATKITKNASFSFSHTYTHSEQKSGPDRGQPLTQIPEHLFRADLEFNLSQNINAWLQLDYRAQESEPTSLEQRQPIIAPSITALHIGTSFKLPAGFNLKLSVQNIGDEVASFDEYGYVEDGRHLWIALNKSF